MGTIAFDDVDIIVGNINPNNYRYIKCTYLYHALTSLRYFPSLWMGKIYRANRVSGSQQTMHEPLS